MNSDFIVLKCPNCAGKLEVHHDMEYFSCAYCGMEIMARRRGGTVVLQAIETAIGKVQVGTDKTAAELAIVRHQREIEDLAAQVAAAEQKRKKEAAPLGCLALFTLFLSLAWLGGGHPYWSVAALAATIALFAPMYHPSKAHRRWLADVEATRRDLEEKIAEKRELADA